MDFGAGEVIKLLEREMEDLLAAYPHDFFPRHSFVLRGRQQAFAGVGRFDLLFEDQFQTKILVELKARTAKYEDADQVAKYKDELEKRGQKNVLMWLVAPHIPKSVCEFLDRIGIQYTEIHVGEFQRVAERHGINLSSESALAPESTRPRLVGATFARTVKPGTTTVETGPRVTKPCSLRWKQFGHDLVLQNLHAFDIQGFSKLVDAFEQSVPSGKNAHLISDLRHWLAQPQSKLALGSCSSLLRWVTTSGWKDAVPHAEAIWKYLFGEPSPTWYVWDQSRKKYSFDGEGWDQWYESLPH